MTGAGSSIGCRGSCPGEPALDGGIGQLVWEEREDGGRDDALTLGKVASRHRLSICAVDLEASIRRFHGIFLRPRRGLISPIPDWRRAHTRAIQVESLAFSERYELLVADDQDEIMARQLLSPSLVIWLAEHPLAPGFELRAGMLVVFVDRPLEDEGNLTYLMDATRQIAARVAEETRDAASARRPPRRPRRVPRVRAVQIDEFGGPEVLKVVDLPIPEPAEGEVLVRVARAGMNFADTHQRENSYLARFELPLVLGGEVAGTDPDGRRVVSLLRSGGYAEHAAAPADQTFAIPDGVDDGAALALLIQGLTAWHLYRTSAKLAKGESVVVVSGAGGVGSLAVQLAKPFGAGRVIATASSEEKRARTLELGADAAVDPAAEDLTAAILEANEGRQVDVVLEMSGRAHVRRRDGGARAVRADGRLRDRRP